MTIVTPGCRDVPLPHSVDVQKNFEELRPVPHPLGPKHPFTPPSRAHVSIAAPRVVTVVDARDAYPRSSMVLISNPGRHSQPVVAVRLLAITIEVLM